ncbi:unnamed protein product [Meganyctiphanes norvegica]|uniref:C2 domain-containing protein n=1 Tax=Meganyctiphanes norvegica TaxID=48144 RepID=A0AAV2RVJ5_MEGNR
MAAHGMTPPPPMGGPPGPTMSVPATLVEISVSAHNLRNRDTFSKSDPVCVLYIKETGQDKYYKVGCTEQIRNNLNPEWVNSFDLEYRFEERQILLFRIYDWDNESRSGKDQDSLGFVEVSLGEIMGNMGESHCIKSLDGGSGTLKIIAEEISNTKEIITINFIGSDLDKKDLIGNSDPFLIFHRSNDMDDYTVVHKTEVIKNTLNPVWKPIVIPARTLCAGDHNRSIWIECYDYDFDGGHDLIGECVTNVKTLLESGTNFAFHLINPKKKANKSSYKDSGSLVCKGASSHVEPSFLDFIRGGTQIHFTVAVDFTKSNGDPKTPTSLHFRKHGVDNQYSLAIKAVGEIIQDYDSDKLFPALGFGAKIPPNWEVSNEFYLNGSHENPYCQGLEGILWAYERSLASVRLYGPTKFAPVINHVAKFAKAYQDGNSYFVLLIVTDGLIKDLPATKHALVKASYLPMSVIIVAVGNEDFSKMEILDGDDQRLSSDGKYAVRDIVQFVELRRHLHKGGGSNHLSQALLAKEVLAEIPRQMLSWMKSRNIHPRDPVVPLTPNMNRIR